MQQWRHNQEWNVGIIRIIPKTIRSEVSFGVGHSLIRLIFSGWVIIPFLETKNPQNSTSDCANMHLDGLANNLFFLRHSRTFLRCSTCCSNDLEKIIISSRYTCTKDLRNGAKIPFIIRWNVAGALVSPKGITIHWKLPNCVLNAVLGMCSFRILSWWYPLAKSNLENIEHAANLSNCSSILGIGYLSLMVIEFNPL